MCDTMAFAARRMFLSKYGIQFNPENSRIRCMAHVVNLVAQAILGNLKEADDPSDEDYFFHHRNEAVHLDPDQVDCYEGGAADYDIESDDQDDSTRIDDSLIDEVIKLIEEEIAKNSGATPKPTLTAVKKVK